MSNITIGNTTKGARVWLQSVHTRYPEAGTYNVHYINGTITVDLLPTTGKRKVTQAKGGIIDIVGKRVTQWAQGATMAHVTYTATSIIITPVGD